MQDFFIRLSIPVVLIALLAALIWSLSSVTVALAFTVIALLSVMARHGRQLYKLGNWLNDPRPETMPEASGIWDQLFSGLYRIVKQHIQTKQNLADELQHIELATAALPEGVVILNNANRIEWFNALARQHFDLDPGRDILQDITYLVRQPEFIDYLRHGDFTNPLPLVPARHSEMTLSITFVPYGDDKHLMISRDITQFKRVEAMRRDFVANVSHELRTPLTVVNGYVENLLEMPDLSEEHARRALQQMAEQTLRMENLVADLLTLSRLESEQNPPHDEVVNMKSLLEEVYRDGESLSGGRHTLRVEVASDSDLFGSREELRSAFGNLVSNAIRYTPDGGPVTLRWFERDGQPVFSVQDSGIGIAPHHIPRLTERFYRVDRSRSRETGGTGLGLAIVKHIAIRHQTKLEVVSEEGKGSTFSLVFPKKRASS